MTEAQPFDRRRDERRQLDLGPLFQGTRAGDWQFGTSMPGTSSLSARAAPDRRSQDRRVADRRKTNLGPPPGIDERRFRPDPRGVVFLHIGDCL